MSIFTESYKPGAIEAQRPEDRYLDVTEIQDQHTPVTDFNSPNSIGLAIPLHSQQGFSMQCAIQNIQPTPPLRTLTEPMDSSHGFTDKDSYSQNLRNQFVQENNLPFGFEIPNAPNDANNLIKYRSFIPSIFISAALPLRDVKKQVFERKYNNITLHLSSPNLVPYGKYGRLLLSILTTHAVQSKNNLNKDGTITITYSSLQELLDEMQLRKQRGTDIMEQLNRFKSATFIYEDENISVAQKGLFPEFFSESDRGFVQAKKLSIRNIMFIDSLQYIELDDSISDKRNISFSIVLNNKFVELCKRHSVPIDYTVYKEISSAMGKDLYAWIIYRNNSIGKDGIFIPRSSMVAQFSGTIQPEQERANFRYIVDQIQQIKAKYYPGLRFTVDRDSLGITFYKSPQIMQPKDTRYVLATNI